jgi:hypothetical protein
MVVDPDRPLLGRHRITLYDRSPVSSEADTLGIDAGDPQT